MRIGGLDPSFFLSLVSEEVFRGVEEMMLANLKAALAARRIRQADLAMSLKIAPSVLSEIVCGRRQADTGLRARIAEHLGADEAWLFASVVHIPQPIRAQVPEPLKTAIAAGAL